MRRIITRTGIVIAGTYLIMLLHYGQWSLVGYGLDFVLAFWRTWPLLKFPLFVVITGSILPLIVVSYTRGQRESCKGELMVLAWIFGFAFLYFDPDPPARPQSGAVGYIVTSLLLRLQAGPVVDYLLERLKPQTLERWFQRSLLAFSIGKRILVIAAVIIVARGIYVMMNWEKETAEQETCEKAVETAYYGVTAPLLREIVSLSTENLQVYLAESKRFDDKLNQIGRKHLEEWWECHIRFIPQDRRMRIEKSGRWEEYKNLVGELSEFIDRYTFKNATDLLLTYGEESTAAELRNYHKK